MTYRERRLAKAERLREWADKREEKADAAYSTAHNIGSQIPFGQPIRYRRIRGVGGPRVLVGGQRVAECGTATRRRSRD